MNKIRMSKIISSETALKIASILFALVMWFLVNPIKTKTLSVPLTIKNEDVLRQRAITLKDRDFQKYVQVTIRGREDKVNKVNVGDFQVSIDFARITDVGDGLLEVEGPGDKLEGVLVVGLSPRYIKVELEKIEERTFPLVVERTGSPKAGYRIVLQQVSEESVTLQGVSSLLNLVDKVKVVIDTEGLDRDTLFSKQPIKVLDKNGNEIAELGRDKTVDINIKVAREVPVKFTITGEPAPNYVFDSASINPEKVLITGDAEALSKVKELWVDPININGITRNIARTLQIKLTEGIKLYNSPKDATVTVMVEALVNKTLVVGKDMVVFRNFDASLEYTLNTESIDVVVKDRAANLARVTVESLNPYVDVTGLGEGSHKLPLRVEIPSTSKLVGEYFVEVVITKPAPPAEQE